MKVFLFVMGIIASLQTIIQAEEKTTWDVRSCKTIYSTHLKNYNDLFYLKKSDTCIPDHFYLFSAFLSTDPPASVALAPQNCRIIGVQINGIKTGRNRNGSYEAPCKKEKTFVNIAVLAESTKVAVNTVSSSTIAFYSCPAVGTMREPRLFAEIDDCDSAMYRIRGNVSQRSSVFINGTFIGEMIGNWTHRLFLMERPESLVVKASNFFGSDQQVIRISSKAAKVPVISDKTASKDFPGSFSGASSTIKKTPNSEKFIVSRFRAQEFNNLVDHYGEKVVSSNSAASTFTVYPVILDVEKDPYLIASVKAPDNAFWKMKTETAILSEGKGSVESLRIGADLMASYRGVTELSLVCSGLKKKSSLFVLKNNGLIVKYSKIALSTDGDDSITIIPQTSIPACRFELFNQDWFRIYADSGKTSFVWNGKSFSGRKIPRGTYYSVLTIFSPQGEPSNHLQKIIAAPKDVFLQLSSMSPTGKIKDEARYTTIFSRKDSIEIRSALDSNSRVDTVLSEGRHLIVVAGHTPWGIDVFDTICVVIDKTPPVIKMDDSIVTRDSVVKVTYLVDDQKHTFDTTLSEGFHRLFVASIDSAGNTSIDSIAILVDRIPPVVTILSPLNNSVTNKDTVVISWNIDGKAYSSDTVLKEGPHVISRGATDVAGNTATATVMVTVDKTPPVVTILSPLNNSVTKKDTVAISWNIDGKTYSSDTVLTEGPHGISRSATDAAGNTATAMVTVTVDKTPPVVTILAPVNNSVTNKDTVTISWNVDGNAYSSDTVLTEGVHGISRSATSAAGKTSTATVTVTVDKTPPVVTILSPENNSVTNKDTVTISWNVDGKAYSSDTVLSEGPHGISRSATDAAGNTATATLTVTVDKTPPVVTILAPVNNSVTNKDTVTISWNVDGKAYFSDTVLAEGPNVISRSATDAAGNIATATVTVTVDKTPPVVTILAPVNNSVTNKDTVTISWNVDGKAYSSDTVLSEGPHGISRSATDAAGNIASATVTVTVDKTPPVVTILAPVNNSVTNKDTVTISWNVDGNAYSFDTVLTEGQNVISRSATDAAGNTATATITVTVDKTPPVVLITSPGVDTAITVSAFMVKYTVDGKPYEKRAVLEPGVDTVIIKESDAAGNFGMDTVLITFLGSSTIVFVSPSKDTIMNTTLVHLVWVDDGIVYSKDTTLSEGVHQIVRNASGVGKTGSASINIAIDLTPPLILQVSPNHNATVFSPDGHVHVTYSVDGQTNHIDTLVPAGPVSLPVSGVDSAGNIANATLDFIMDSPFPSIAIVKPDALISSFQPEIVVAYGSAPAAVNTSRFAAFLDSKNVTGRFTITADTARWVMSNSDSVNNGAHKLIVSIANVALNQATDTFSFNVSHVIAQPVAKPDSGAAALRVNFITKAFDPLGTVEWYLWDFEGDGIVDQKVQVARTFSYIYGTPGIYFPTLEVISTTGQHDTARLRIVVTPSLPDAFASIKPSNGPAPLTASLTGWGSSKSGYIKYHEWDIDGNGTRDTSILVAPDTVMLLQEDFETGRGGWSAGGNSGVLDTCTWPSNIDSMWATNASGANYPNNMKAWILSPQINIPAASACSLSFWQYFYTYVTYGDTGYIDIDTGSGGFVNIKKYVGYFTGVQKLDCSQFLGKKISLRFRFISDAVNTYPGWQLDSIMLYTTSAGVKNILFSDRVENSSVAWTANLKGDVWIKIPKINVTYQMGLQKKWVEASPDTPSYRNNMDCWLTSPPIILDSNAKAGLVFWQHVYTYNTGDGATVELSRNNGAFTVMAPVGGYPDSILNKCRGYAGSRGISRPKFNLSSYAGDTIQFRFRFYSDNVNTYYRGWLIDSVRVFQVFPPDVPDTSLVYSENFESQAAGWTFGAASGASSIGLDSVSNKPDSAWATTNDSAVQYSDNLYMTSDSIFLPPMHACTLSYWYRSNYTTGYVQVDTVGAGAFYQLAYNYTGEGQMKIGIKTTGAGGDTIKLRFYYTGYNGGPYKYGWWIDNITVAADSVGTAKDTVFLDRGDGSKNWVSTSAYGHSWIRNNKMLKGKDNYWVETWPDSVTFPNNDDSWVESPKIFLPGGDLELSFDNYLSSQVNYDGGWLEVSSNGGAYQKLTPTGSPYYNTIYRPAGSTTGFTGSINWAKSIFDLAPYVGTTVGLRFHFVSNATVNTGKWIIDNIRIYDRKHSSHIYHTYANQGAYHPVFSVVDNQGNRASAPAVMTNVYSLTPGSPSVISNANPQTGTAPLTVNFKATGYDSDGTIAKYEWDFDGDGVIDWSSAVKGDTSYSYKKAGAFTAMVKVTDNSGLSCFEQHLIHVNPQFTISFTGTYADRTFNPYKSENMCVTTVQSGEVPVMVYVRDSQGAIVRTLAGKKMRLAGTYNDCWDGRNESGVFAQPGAYYAVVKYWVGADEKTIDLADTTGGGQYNPTRSANLNFEVKPFENQFLPLSFTIPQPSEVVLFMGLLSGADLRLRTLLNFEPMGAGSYTVYWDGLTDDGKIPYANSGDLLPGIWGYYLPDNCIWLQTQPPEIASVTINPSHFVPLDESCGPTGNMNGVTFNFSLSDSAAKVIARVYNTQSGVSIWEKDWANVGSGGHTYFWDGRLSDGKFIDENIYRIGFAAEDKLGNRSLWQYNLMRTLYTFQPPKEEE